jgi:hypothetical protein
LCFLADDLNVDIIRFDGFWMNFFLTSWMATVIGTWNGDGQCVFGAHLLLLFGLWCPLPNPVCAFSRI